MQLCVLDSIRSLFGICLRNSKLRGACVVDIYGLVSECYCRYYAAPTIHHAILASQVDSGVRLQDIHIRMICNAAGGLMPSLASKMRDTFNGAVILPSYGMTESVFISL